MTLLLNTCLAFLSGSTLGLMFYGGLWITLNRACASVKPFQWLMVSALLRFTLVLMAFLVLFGGHWVWWSGALLGFIVARTCLLSLLVPETGLFRRRFSWN